MWHDLITHCPPISGYPLEEYPLIVIMSAKVHSNLTRFNRLQFGSCCNLWFRSRMVCQTTLSLTLVGLHIPPPTGLFYSNPSSVYGDLHSAGFHLEIQKWSLLGMSECCLAKQRGWVRKDRRFFKLLPASFIPVEIGKVVPPFLTTRLLHPDLHWKNSIECKFLQQCYSHWLPWRWEFFSFHPLFGISSNNQHVIGQMKDLHCILAVGYPKPICYPG